MFINHPTTAETALLLLILLRRFALCGNANSKRKRLRFRSAFARRFRRRSARMINDISKAAKTVLFFFSCKIAWLNGEGEKTRKMRRWWGRFLLPLLLLQLISQEYERMSIFAQLNFRVGTVEDAADVVQGTSIGLATGKGQTEGLER